MEAKSKFQFTASQPDELSFSQGCILKIRKMEDEGWYEAEVDGKVGMVPATYLQKENNEWYKGKMTREEAELFLLKKHASNKDLYQDGAFVIRDCQADRNQFSLSVKHGTTCQHFKIFSKPNGTYYLWPDMEFGSLNKLIDYHRSASVARQPNTNLLLRDLQQTSDQTLPKKCPTFRALYNFEPRSDEELKFSSGDLIRLLEKADECWWMGELLESKKQGLFPSNYVQEI